MFIDQAIKFAIMIKLPAEGMIFFDFDFLKIHLEKSINQYAAFGIKFPLVLIILLTTVAIAMLLYYENQLLKKGDRFDILLTSLITGAAASNLLDRFAHRGVVDYFSISVYNFSWPAFNLADFIIVVCLFLFVINELRKKTI